MTRAAVKANDIVIWHGSRWRVVLSRTGQPGRPATVRLMRVVEVAAAEVTLTGETYDNTRRAAARP